MTYGVKLGKIAQTKDEENILCWVKVDAKAKIGGLDFGNKPITINCLEMRIVDHHWGSLTYDLWGEIGEDCLDKR